MEIVKLEIIIANSFLSDLVQRLEKLGVEGYTALDVSRGKGMAQGEHLSEGLLPVTRNTLLFTVIHKTLSLTVVDQLSAYLKERGGMIIISEVVYCSRK